MVRLSAVEANIFQHLADLSSGYSTGKQVWEQESFGILYSLTCPEDQLVMVSSEAAQRTSSSSGRGSGSANSATRTAGCLRSRGDLGIRAVA